jgi:hypothetical protein
MPFSPAPFSPAVAIAAAFRVEIAAFASANYFLRILYFAATLIAGHWLSHYASTAISQPLIIATLSH